jgi:hypothetical protein
MRRVYFASFAAFASSEIAYFLRQRERVYGKIRDMTLPAANIGTASENIFDWNAMRWTGTSFMMVRSSRCPVARSGIT